MSVVTTMPTAPYEGGTPLKPWWTVPQEKVADAALSLVKIIRDNSSQHAMELITAFRLYGNFESRGIAAGNYFRPNTGRTNRLTLNVIASCVDTLVARIAKQIPKPSFLTSGGSWGQQKKAKLLDKFCVGLFYQMGFEKKARRVVRDTCVFGKGIVKVFEDPLTKRVAIDRIFPDELLVDEMEAVDGLPRTIYQLRNLPREVVRGMFPDEKNKSLIDKAKAAELGSASHRQVETADMITVIEAWHLPSVKVPDIEDGVDAEDPEAWREASMKGHDGRHVFIIDSGTLLLEAWRESYFPFCFLDYKDPTRGFWTSGIPMALKGIQYELNKILRKIQESIDWCVPKAFVELSSKVVLDHLDDVAGGIIRYSGTKPTIEALPALSPQLLEQAKNLVQQAYEETGISQLSAQSKKPSGLESGASLREYHDIETERFAMQGVGLEDFVMDVARMAIRTARAIAKRDGDYGVNSPQRRKMVVKINWSEIDLDDDDFVMQVFPSSSLPRTPAGRLAMVNDLMQLGFLDKEDVLRLLNFPDLEAVNELMEAAAEFTNMQIENMVEKGKAEMPQPFQNIAYALKHAQAAYLLASTLGVPESHLERLIDYMEECKVLMGQTGQPGPGAGAQPGILGGPPGPPPFGVPGSAPPPAPMLAAGGAPPMPPPGAPPPQ